MSSWLSAAWRFPFLGAVLLSQPPGKFLESDEPLQGQASCPPLQLQLQPRALPGALSACYWGECSPQSSGVALWAVEGPLQPPGMGATHGPGSHQGPEAPNLPGGPQEGCCCPEVCPPRKGSLASGVHPGLGAAEAWATVGSPVRFVPLAAGGQQGRGGDAGA